MDRRQFLTVSGLAVVGPSAAAGGFAADRDYIGLQLRRMLGMYESAPTRDLLRTTAALVERTLRLGRNPSALTHRQLTQVAGMKAQLFTIRGDLRHKAGDAAGGLEDCERAYALAKRTGNAELMGFARRVQATINLFNGQPEPALAAARDGQLQVSGGPVYASLAAEEARALGRLPYAHGDDVARTVDRAVRAARALPLAQIRPPGPFVDGYGPADAEYRAVCAFAAAGEVDRAETAAGEVLPTLDNADLPDFSAVARFELATAHAAAHRPQVDRAAELGIEGLSFARRRTQHVEARVMAMLAALDRHREVPEVVRLRDKARVWLDPPPPTFAVSGPESL